MSRWSSRRLLSETVGPLPPGFLTECSHVSVELLQRTSVFAQDDLVGVIGRWNRVVAVGHSTVLSLRWLFLSQQGAVIR